MYVVLQGNGSAKYADEEVPLKTEDYLYIPSTIPHALANTSAAPLTVVVMGFYTKGFEKAPIPSHPLKANIEDVPTTLVNGHPDSSRFRLLMGDVDSKRDRIAGGRVLTSLFLMEIAPGGTNFPHHHQREEEIYLILSGHGVIVAGGGMDGIAGRHPAKAGDAYFFRLNATVGYYSAPDVAIAAALRTLLVSGHATKGSTALICRTIFCRCDRRLILRELFSQDEKLREMERISWEDKCDIR